MRFIAFRPRRLAQSVQRCFGLRLFPCKFSYQVALLIFWHAFRLRGLAQVFVCILGCPLGSFWDARRLAQSVSLRSTSCLLLSRLLTTCRQIHLRDMLLRLRLQPIHRPIFVDEISHEISLYSSLNQRRDHRSASWRWSVLTWPNEARTGMDWACNLAVCSWVGHGLHWLHHSHERGRRPPRNRWNHHCCSC